MITPSQIRAARAMLKWSARELSDKAGIGIQTVQRMEQEGGTENTLMKNVRSVKSALENSGVQFLMNNGVRYYQGEDNFQDDDNIA